MASVAELTDPAYTAGLNALPLEAVREKRAVCQAVEDAVSYLRRVAQGRLDIVRAGGDPEALVEQLPAILSERLAATGVPGRLPTVLSPNDVPDDLRAAVENANSEAQLVQVEERLSTLRRALHETIDALDAELVRRYKSGEASVDSLLG